MFVRKTSEKSADRAENKKKGKSKGEQKKRAAFQPKRKTECGLAHPWAPEMFLIHWRGEGNPGTEKKKG